MTHPSKAFADEMADIGPRCEACDKVLEVGDWPFCPHGRSHGVSVIDDQIEGGPRFFDTMGHEPVWIESKSQWKAEVAARGLIHNDRHDRAHYDRFFKQHDERIRDTKAKS